MNPLNLKFGELVRKIASLLGVQIEFDGKNIPIQRTVENDLKDEKYEE